MSRRAHIKTTNEDGDEGESFFWEHWGPMIDSSGNEQIGSLVVEFGGRTLKGTDGTVKLGTHYLMGSKSGQPHDQALEEMYEKNGLTTEWEALGGVK